MKAVSAGVIAGRSTEVVGGSFAWITARLVARLSWDRNCMTIISRSLLLAASLAVSSTVNVLAQTDHDAGAPGGMVSPPVHASGPMVENPHVPGATGKAIVPGDNSTVAADHRATVEQKTGQGSSAGGGSD